ncbi:MAG TPA: hypothetical protein ENF16_03240, partial [Bacteroidetes bacterium]|nr:hypothetical protein [Bacteroidota bacterium]
MGRPHKARSKRKTPLPGGKKNLRVAHTDMAEEILAVLTDRPGLYGIKGLFRELGLSRKRYNEYRQTLHNLLDNGQIVHLGRRRLAVRKKPKIIQGILRLTPHGYGFIDRQEDSIFINAREARKAFDGDLVEVEVID